VPSRRTLYDHTGRAWELDQQLAAGGEGTVHILAGDATLLAKVYNQPPSSGTEQKLRWMVHTASPSLRQLAAWPTAVLSDKPDGGVVGFLMPRFHEYQPIHHLYNPAQRLKYFPRADWAFLAAAARNCAAAFEEVHHVGCLVGDVNQSNVLVSRKALIGLIDCDSFQVQVNGRQFLCEVGVPHYTPPELQRRNFTGLVRTLNHDRFGLSVLLFQLLFMGRHPYAGCYLGAGDPPFEQLIQEFRFAYGPRAAALQMERPPHTLALSDVSPNLAHLFESAFERGSEGPDVRPTATQWLAALDEFRAGLRACPKDPGHKIPGHRPTCPWCEFMGAGGPNYFRGVAVVAVVFKFDAGRLRTLTERIRRATAASTYDRSRFLPREPMVPRALPAEFNEARTLSRVLGGVALGGVALVTLSFVFTSYLALFGVPILIVFGLWWLIHRATSPRYREYRRRLHALTNAETLLRRAEHDWQRQRGDYGKHENQVRKSLDRIFEQCRRLEGSFRGEGQQLEKNREAMLLEQHLRGCFISDADIPGIGPTRQQLLASFGIETAFDIEPGPIDMIKGFGKVLTGNLMAWKKQMIKDFRYDPSKSIPESELRTLALKYQQAQETLFGQLERGAAELENLAAGLERDLQAREPELRQRAAAWAQAKADLQVLASRRRRG
jgi:DNA-binding helix-hairpin-helix protein with protein kinase domain